MSVPAGSSGRQSSSRPPAGGSSGTWRQLTLPGAAAAQRNKKATRSMAMWFYANGIPFNTARSPYFRRMVAAVAAAGAGFTPPSYLALRTTLLDEVGG